MTRVASRPAHHGDGLKRSFARVSSGLSCPEGHGRPRQDSAACASLPSNLTCQRANRRQNIGRSVRSAFQDNEFPTGWPGWKPHVIERAMPVEGGEALCAPRQGPNKYKTNGPVNTNLAQLRKYSLIR